jgi:hypothetical protein
MPGDRISHSTIATTRGIYLFNIMYPDNLEECLKHIVKTAANFKAVANEAGHPVTLEQATVIVIAQLQERTADQRCRQEVC